MARATATMKFLARIQCGTDMAAEIVFGILQRGKYLLERDVVGDHEHVDVAGCGVGVLRNRAVQERKLDAFPQRSERRTQSPGNTGSLLYDRAQLREDRRRGVCLVALLTPDRRGDHQCAVEKPLQLALHSAG